MFIVDANGAQYIKVNDGYIPLGAEVYRFGVSSDHDHFVLYNGSHMLEEIKYDDMTKDKIRELQEKYPYKETIREDIDKDMVLGWATDDLSDYIMRLMWVLPENKDDMWGDDWDDSPFDCNAGEIYEKFVDLNETFLLNPGWVFEPVEEYCYHMNNDRKIYNNSHGWYGGWTDYSIQGLIDNELEFGRFVNTRTGEDIGVVLGKTTRNELYRRLKESKAID